MKYEEVIVSHGPEKGMVKSRPPQGPFLIELPLMENLARIIFFITH